MRAFKILVLFLALPQTAFCGGFSDWYYTTPIGNTISGAWRNDEVFVTIQCGQMYDGLKDSRTIVENIERWYLYRHHILGKYWQNGIQRYFIFNETDCACETFDNVQAFDESRTGHHLKPMFWTRWYDDSDMDAYRSLGDLSFLFFQLPLLLLCALLCIVQLVKTRFSLKNRLNQLSLLFFCVLLLWHWLDSHPQSF